MLGFGKPKTSPATTPVREKLGLHYPRATIILLALAGATVAAAGLSNIRGIVAPTLLALILTICAAPVRTLLEKRGVPRGIATGSVILVVFVLLGGFIGVLLIAFAQFVAMLPTFSSEIAAVGDSVTAWLVGLGVGFDQVQSVSSYFDVSNILGFLTGLFGSVFSVTGFLVIVLTSLIVMAADSTFMPVVLRQLSQVQPSLADAATSFAVNVRRYMVVTSGLGIAQGILNTVALWILGVPAALLWGLLAFLCSFIPNVGYFFAIIPPLVFGFLVGGWPTVIAIVIVYGVINAVVQTLIQPRVVGNAVQLSQTVTFISVLFWAFILGPIGAILAVPLTLLARAFLIEADPSLQWLRPAVGPTGETLQIMKDDDVAKKQRRRDRRAKPAT